MTGPETFDQNIAAWTEQQHAPWLRLRYAVAHRNIVPHLDASPLRILDVGGGNARDALPLAMLGHRVTLVDFSAEMLSDARRSAEAAGVGERLDVHQAELTALPALVPPASFDVALCHNVLQYVDDPAAVLKHIAITLRPGGLVSVICPNRFGEAYLAALLQLDLKKALERLDATTVIANMFQVPVRRFTGVEMLELLRTAGCDGIGEYGLLCVCAYIANNELKYEPTFYAQLEQLELAMTGRFPYYLTGRFFQVLARKSHGRSENA